MSLSQAILTDFEAERILTLAVLQAVPEGKGDWKPHEKSMTLAQLAGHIAETPSWTSAMLEDVMDLGNAMKDWKPFVSSSPTELVATLDEHAAAMRQMLDGRDDAYMLADWSMQMDGKEVMREPRHQAIRSTILHHSAHHRGQLTVYLRMLDVPVPMTYGSTADFSMF